MLTVTSLNGETEPLNLIKDFIVNEEVNGAFTVSLTSFLLENNPGHDLLEEESIITVDGYDFRVKQMKESPNRKTVTGISTFYDLIGHRQENIYGGTRTFNEFATFVFGGTGWTFENVDVTGSVFIPNYGDDNVIKLVQVLCAAYECEYKIMPNNHIIFKEQIGGDYDAQYRYGHNVKALSKSVDTTNLRTSIKGYGGNGLVVTYTSPNISQFPNAGEAEPIRDDRFTIAASLTEHVKQKLIDFPETSIELDSVELINKELGERVWLIYEPLNIEFQTRVMAKKSVMRNGKIVTASVVIGNSTSKKMSDILTEQSIKIDENNKQTTSRIDQTNENITLEVERIDENISTLSINADNIQLSVSNLSGRMGNAESQISIQAGQITQKVSQSDYNGEKLVSMINLTPDSVKIEAKNITLQGAVTVLSELSDNLGYIRAGNIDISESIKIGQSVTFSDFTNISTGGGGITLNAWNDIVFAGARHIFYGSVDFDNRLVSNLNLPNYAKAHTNGLGIAYNGSSRIYFRINGSDIGYVSLSQN